MNPWHPCKKGEAIPEVIIGLSLTNILPVCLSTLRNNPDLTKAGYTLENKLYSFRMSADASL